MTLTRWVAAIVLISVSPVSELYAQGDVVKEVEALSAKAKSLYDQQDYRGAAEVFEQISQKVTLETSSEEAMAQLYYNLCLNYCLARDYEKSIAAAMKVKGDKKNPKVADAIENAAYIKSSAKSQIAQAATDKAQKEKLLNETIQYWDELLKEFPSGNFTGDAWYGKALVQLLNEDYEQAQKSIDEYGKARKESLNDEVNALQARLHTQRARNLEKLAKQEEGQGKKGEAQKKREEALIYYAKANEILEKSIKASSDSALANITFLTTGDGYAKNNNYTFALRALRRVIPKADIERIQGEWVDRLKAQRRSLGPVQTPKAKELDQYILRTQGRLNELIKIKYDAQFMKAQILIAQCFFGLERIDETLFLCRHLLKFELDPVDKKMTRYLLAKATIAKQDGPESEIAYNDFEKNYPTEEWTRDLLFSLAKYFHGNDQFDKSVTWSRHYKQKFPQKNQELEEVYFMILDGLTRQGNLNEAKTATEEFAKEFPESSLMSQARLRGALNDFDSGNYSQAIIGLQDFSKKFPDDANIPFVFYKIAAGFHTLTNYPACIQAVDELEKSPTASKSKSFADLFPNALYLKGHAQYASKKGADAIATYNQIVKMYPKNDISPKVLVETGSIYIGMGGKYVPEALKAWDQFLKEYPDHELVPAVMSKKAGLLLWLAISPPKDSAKRLEAIEIYKKIELNHGNSDFAGEAMVAIADLYWQDTYALGTAPENFSEEKKLKWKANAEKTLEAYLGVLKKYPKSKSVDKALSNISGVWNIKIKASLGTLEEAEAVFDSLSNDAKDQPELQTKIKFALGALLALIFERDFENVSLGKKAMIKLQSAFDSAGNASLPNEGYKQYRDLLLEENDDEKFKMAQSISERQLREKTEARDLEGISQAELGLGQACYKLKKYTEATQHLNTVVNEYAKNFPADGFEAQYVLAGVDAKLGKYDSAIKRISDYLQSTAFKQISGDLKQRSLLRHAYILVEKGYKLTGDAKRECLKVAIQDLNLLSGSFATRRYSPEASYMRGQYLEECIPLSSAEEKAELKKRALESYTQCAEQYGKTSWGAKARDALKRLGK